MRGLALPVLLAASLAVAAPAAEAAPAAPLDIREGAMAAALAQLARQARVDLLYDRQLVRGLTARAVRGRFTGEVALAKLLAGTGVGYRATPDGAFVLFAIPAPRPVEGDGAIAELLVVGRRTQNVDIRRSENDIQPYRIASRREMEASGRETVDDFLRARETANTQAGPLALGGGQVRSSINLRGLGETSTLVLVDGRRMPHVPSILGELSQADINGIPLGAVERIEVLTTTAGGIYGPGAIGGVVNVVLRRDYRGADLTVYGGVSDRGDAEQGRIEGRLGFTPDHGATDVMLFVSHAEAVVLRTGGRSYAERALRRRFENDPNAFVANLPNLNGVSVVSFRGDDLTLDPQYGGAALGARFSYLPIGFSGTPADAAALLVANAGKLPLELSDDVPGRRGQIATAPSATSGILNVRRRIGSSVEAYFDGLYARNRGNWTGGGGPSSFGLAASDSGNPFGQDISLSFPVGILGAETSQSFEISRWSAGAIVDLPHSWKASVDYTAARSRVRLVDNQPTAGLTLAVRSGQPGPNGEPAVKPFGDWAAVVAALPAYVETTSDTLHLHEKFREASLRLSGPLWTLPGGPLTATLLVEDLRNSVADSSFELFGLRLELPARSFRVRSAYMELRAPIGALDADSVLLRGLEVQLAVRHDRSTQDGPTELLVLDPDDVERFSVRYNATTFTAGARLRPAPWLMFRASLATGERPPTLTDLQTISSTIFRGPEDPRRPGRLLGTEGTVTILAGGSTGVSSAHAESATVGAVFNPEGRGPRFSLDYSRIVVSNEPAPFPLSMAELLADEATYPDRVIRADLTPEDRALGLTAGRVIALDTSAVNVGRTIVEAVDAQFDWLLPMDRHGDVRLYGAVTWQPTFRERESPRAPTIARTDYTDGPLEWRGNAGVEWVRGDTSVDLNAQYYGSYRVSYAEDSAEGAAQAVRYQGAERVPTQVYVDLNLRQRFSLVGSGPLRALEARLSIQNLFDHSPPIDISSLQGFSEYGDPRRRRFVLTLSAQF